MYESLAVSYKVILKMKVNLTSLSFVVDNISSWCEDGVGRYVCVSNVHMCMETFDEALFKASVNGSDLTIPDGLPMVWAQRLLGYSLAEQVRGTDLMLALCKMAAREKKSVGFLGATPKLLQSLERELCDKFSGLDIGYVVSPPFRQITEEEDQQYIDEINASGVKILFVGLGCPKQEKWMAEHKDVLQCTMLGVGAAFDFIAGNKKHAPSWMQAVGLEWLFRLATEPRRLWRRYLKHNPRFVYYFILQLLGRKYE